MGVLKWLWFGADVPCSCRNTVLCVVVRPLALLRGLVNCCCCGVCCVCPSPNVCYGGYGPVTRDAASASG